MSYATDTIINSLLLVRARESLGDSACESIDKALEHLAYLDGLLNSPETAHFLDGVRNEAAH